MGNNIDKSWGKKLSGKCSQKVFDHPKQSVTDALKTTSKRVIQEKAKLVT